MGSFERPAPAAVLFGSRYEIEQAIGHGGVADVYRGRDVLLERPVAVKVLREVTAEPAARERFLAEARTLAALSHPGLVTILDAGIENAGMAGERPYLVMELVEGRMLADACRPNGLDVGAVAAIGAQVAEALAYVHARGIVHRDVKPANVLLSGDGRVLLADFGIAKLTEDAAALTAAGAVVGTAAYIAPEQLRGGPIGPALDVYSFALVLLEARTGRPAYPGGTIESAAARLSRPPAIPDALPGGLSTLLRQMVAPDPAGRPSLSEVITVLRAVADGGATVRLPAGADAVPGRVGGSATAVLPRPPDGAAPPHPSAPPRTPRVSRQLPVALGLLALLALLVAAGVLLATRDSATETARIPPNLPAQISEDLRDLHEAVNG